MGGTLNLSILFGCMWLPKISSKALLDWSPPVLGLASPMGGRRRGRKESANARRCRHQARPPAIQGAGSRGGPPAPGDGRLPLDLAAPGRGLAVEPADERIERARPRARSPTIYPPEDPPAIRKRGTGLGGGLRNKSGSLAIFAAIRRASSRLISLASMSALPPKADMDKHGRDVRFVPKADIRHPGEASLKGALTTVVV